MKTCESFARARSVTMGDVDSGVYAFGEFRVDAVRRVLQRNGKPIALTPKVFDTLAFMIRRHGQLLEKNELMQELWPDRVVEENNLSQNIAALRRALAERRGENRYILTVPGHGYRFVADVEALDDTPLERVTLAVLPFENLSNDPEREYLADGLTEDTITALGQIDPRQLSVVGRTAVMAYKRSDKAIADIGRELNAVYLVEGSIRAEGGRMRVTAKLIRVRGQLHVWSATFDGEPRSVLEFQRELSRVIAEQVRLQLSPERLAALAHRQTQNADAYDHYLRGRHFWHQLTPETTRSAMHHYAKATHFDPGYALAWCGIADAWCSAPITGDVPPLAALPHARDAVAQALRARPNIAEAKASRGFLAFWLEWDWTAAEEAFRDSIRLDSSYPLPHRMLGLLCSHLGRTREAASEMQRARELDPLLAVHHALSAQVAYAGRDFTAARQFARQAIVIDRDFWIGHFQLAQAQVALGAHEDALIALNDAARLSGGNSKVAALRGVANAKLGRLDDARAAADALASASATRYVPPCAAALVKAALGDMDGALHWLDLAVAARDVHLMFLPIDANWDCLRGDPRFSALLARCEFTVQARDSPASDPSR